MFRTVAVATVATLAAGATVADGSEPEPAAADALQAATSASSRLRMDVLAGVWVPRLGGESRLDTGMGSSNLILETELDLGDLEPIANIELTLTRGDLALHLSGFDFSTSSRGAFDARPSGTPAQQFGSLTLSDGDMIRADADFSSAAIELQFLDVGLNEEEIGDASSVTLTIAPTISARWVRTELSIATAGGRDDGSGDWLGFLAGLSMATTWRPDVESTWLEHIRFGATAAIGPAIGGDGGYIWQVRTGIHMAFTNGLGVVFGYRLVELVLDGDDFEFNGGLQGLFLAGSIRF